MYFPGEASSQGQIALIWEMHPARSRLPDITLALEDFGLKPRVSCEQEHSRDTPSLSLSRVKKIVQSYGTKVPGNVSQYKSM